MFGKSEKFNKEYYYSTFIGLALLLVSLVINFIASSYASKEASNAVSDILLDYLPVVNVSYIFVEGALAFIAFIVILLARKPVTLPYVFKSSALFIFIRAISISLTHIAPFPYHSILDTGEFLKNFVFTGDLFFSGHAGLPFLFALNFWWNRPLRYLFLTCSIIGAVGVILGHIHYTIDVYAAYFITYAVYSLSKEFFKKDYQLFLTIFKKEELQ